MHVQIIASIKLDLENMKYLSHGNSFQSLMKLAQLNINIL